MPDPTRCHWRYSERSGSNLLRLMLHAHSRIAVQSYGDLADEPNRRALACAAHGHIDLPMHVADPPERE